MTAYDVIIIGAGAAGLMCAIEAGKRGRKTLLLDHARAVGEKIRISGGGRCNFTNIHTSPANYLSANPRFCVSALRRYTPRDFIALIEKHRIPYHEKTLGQLFCDGSAQAVIAMLSAECRAANVEIAVATTVNAISRNGTGFTAVTNRGAFSAEALVIATGGPSIPKMGATGFGYDVARQFGLKVLTPRPALVPLTFSGDVLERCKSLAGVAVDAVVRTGKTAFAEALLFTHRGLSGPAILQISSYWREGEAIAIDLAPESDLFALLKEARASQPKQDLVTPLARILPKRLAQNLSEQAGVGGALADLSNAKLAEVAAIVNDWRLVPSGTEGFRTAEVTRGGVDTGALSSKTFECTTVPGLYFIGEVVDVTGHLGGYNFQWAWASGHAAGQYV